MKHSKWIWAACAAVGCTLAFSTATAVAQDKPADKPKVEKKDAPKPAQDPAKSGDAKKDGAAPAGEMDAKMMAEMMAQMETMAQPDENHKLLASMAGEWTTVNKCQMPGMPATETAGTASFKTVLGGRYVIADHKGKMQLPGPDGKMVEKDFEGIGISGFDKAKGKFVNAWIDNMGTMILMSEGTYEPGTKTFTYDAEMEMIPGQKQKVREVIKIIDKDKHTFEWLENQNGTYVKMMEITYTRKK